MIAIIAAIAASVWVGIVAERRRPGRAGHLSRQAMTGLLYTLIPFVIFFNLARVDFDADLGGGVALGLVAVTVAGLIAWLIAARLEHLRRDQVGAVIVCTLVANSGYLGYPLIGTLFGFDRIGEAVVYDVAVSGPALLLGAFAVGAAYGTKAGETPRDRVIAFFTRNPPLFAAIAALLVPDSFAPDLLVDISRIATIAILPVGFFAVGAAIEEEAEEGVIRLPPPITKETATVIGTKLIILPVVLFALALPLIDLPDTFLVLAMMPAGLNSMIVAHAYGLDLRVTAEAVVWTTAIVVTGALVASLL